MIITILLNDGRIFKEELSENVLYLPLIDISSFIDKTFLRYIGSEDLIRMKKQAAFLTGNDKNYIHQGESFIAMLEKTNLYN